MSHGTEHLNALELRLSHERDRLARASTEGERLLRKVWIEQIEREIEQEMYALGMTGIDPDDDTDVDLYTLYDKLKDTPRED